MKKEDLQELLLKTTLAICELEREGKELQRVIDKAEYVSQVARVIIHDLQDTAQKLTAQLIDEEND